MHWPDHFYIPGQTERHKEGAFDALSATVDASMSIDELARSEAFKHGLLYLEHGYYWEAHEVLEPVWMVLNSKSEERRFVQALIQIANAHLKNLMDREKAVRRLCRIARELLDESDSPVVMGVHRSIYYSMLDDLELQLN